MKASPFESEAALGTRRPIIRRNPANVQEVEMVEAGWGLQPWEGQGAKPFKFIRSEGKTFPTHRCLVPASEFQIKNGDRRFRVTLEDGNFFYLAGVWRPANPDWPLSFAVVTIEANPEVFFYQERQGAVLRRRQNMAWLDLTVPQEELLQPLPARSFAIEEIAPRAPENRQADWPFEDMEMLATHPADPATSDAMTVMERLNGVAISAAQFQAAMQVLAVLPEYLRDQPAAQALALQAYAREAGIDDEIGAAALHARVTALAKWTAANDPDHLSDAEAVIEAAARFPLGDDASGVGFEPGGFQELILFIEELPW